MVFGNIVEMAMHVQAVDICFSPLGIGNRVIPTTPLHGNVVVKDTRKSVHS